MRLGSTEIILIVILALVLLGGWLIASMDRELDNCFRDFGSDKKKKDAEQHAHDPGKE